MRRLSLTNLETLCWIARLGSFTAAAERLNTTQPAISARVKELEQALGVALFQRRGRHMELTFRGRDLVERAQPLINQIEDVVVSLDNPAAATGIIRVGVGEMVAVSWFGELMARLQAEMPRVTYQVEVDLTVNMRQKLELGQLDLAIVAAAIDGNRLQTDPLGGIDLLWVSAPRVSRAARAARLDAARLLTEQSMWCLDRPSQMYPMAVAALREHGVSLARVSTCSSLQTMVAMVARGAGIALLPENLVADRLRRRELARLDAWLPPKRIDFVIARPAGSSQAIIDRIVRLAVETSEFS